MAPVAPVPSPPPGAGRAGARWGKPGARRTPTSLGSQQLALRAGRFAGGGAEGGGGVGERDARALAVKQFGKRDDLNFRHRLERPREEAGGQVSSLGFDLRVAGDCYVTQQSS